MRIAHIISTPQGIGGAETVVRALVKAGLERGHQQVLLNPFLKRRTVSDLATHLPHGLVRGKVCEHFWQLPQLRRWLGKNLREFAPEIVHAHLFHAQVAVATLSLSSARKVLTHHHGDVLELEGDVIKRALDRFSGKRYDVVVAVSESVRDYLVRRHGYAPDHVVRIYNGWELAPQPERTREEHEPTVLCIAHFRPQKAHAILIQAFRHVLERVPTARLVLVGEGELLENVRAQVMDLGMENSVEFTGAVDDVGRLFARADVVALASTHEPLGIVVLEAMAFGLPVVATRAGGVPEAVEEGVTGYLVPPNNPAALGTRLADLLQNQSLRERFGVAGKKRSEEFSMGAMVDAYFNLYAALAER